MRFLRLCRAIGLLGICLYVSAAPNAARAFTDPQYFARPANEGGGDGRWFTGAPTDGFGCAVCHGGKPQEKIIVEGLPKNGYVPGESYEVRIAWPDFANRTRDLYATAPAKEIPRASLVAELIAESGEDSGIIVQRLLKDATPGELCKGMQKRLGAVVYRDRPGIPFIENEEPKSVGVCGAVNTTRCLVAVRGCGSEEVRFTWQAPETWQGTIWFSASFAGTDRISQTPLEDGTAEVTIPLVPTVSDGYESELHQACTVTRLSGAHGSLAPLGLLVLLFMWRGLRPRAGGGR